VNLIKNAGAANFRGKIVSRPFYFSVYKQVIYTFIPPESAKVHWFFQHRLTNGLSLGQDYQFGRPMADKGSVSKLVSTQSLVLSTGVYQQSYNGCSMSTKM